LRSVVNGSKANMGGSGGVSYSGKPGVFDVE